jgi:histidine ammonia-lyase
VVQVGSLSEKRLHRLLDRRFSGLPDQLAEAPGRQTGLVLLHKAVVGFAAENRLHAAPAGVHAVDTAAGQEDVQAHAFLAGEKLGWILDNVELMLAAELVAARQARHLRAAPLPPALEAPAARLAAAMEPVGEDRDLSGDLERMRALIRSGELSP